MNIQRENFEGHLIKDNIQLSMDTNNNYSPSFIDICTDIAMSVVAVGEYTERKLWRMPNQR